MEALLHGQHSRAVGCGVGLLCDCSSQQGAMRKVIFLSNSTLLKKYQFTSEIKSIEFTRYSTGVNFYFLTSHFYHFMELFMLCPVLFETFLTTKSTRRNTNLYTGGASHRCIFIASRGRTFKPTAHYFLLS